MFYNAKTNFKYGPYHVDKFEKWFIPMSYLFINISRKTEKYSMLKIEKMCFNSTCQPPSSAILKKVSHAEFNIF